MMTTQAPARRIFTIGHSDHEIDHFLSLLTKHGITAVADVRSQPYSRFAPQYNRESLIESLKTLRISYVFLGRELGARRTEREAYREHQAKYDLVRRLPAYQDGLNRLRQGCESQSIALLCSEKDPLTCHRTILVCRSLRSEPLEIAHILGDGSLECAPEAEMRLLMMMGLPASDLFRDQNELIEQAYDMQSERIAYVEQSESPSRSETVS